MVLQMRDSLNLPVHHGGVIKVIQMQHLAALPEARSGSAVSGISLIRARCGQAFRCSITEPTAAARPWPPYTPSRV
jgi:hypothetical protein